MERVKRIMERVKTGPAVCLIASLLTLSGCIEEFEADLPAEDSNLLVVEGTICSGSLCVFTLSRTQAVNASDTPQKAVLAIVSVRGSDGSEYWAASPFENSLWEGDEGEIVYPCQVGNLNPDVEYYLHIETDSEVYESEPQRPLRTEGIAEIIGVQNTPDSDIDVLITTEAPSEPDGTNYYSWTYDETWEVHPDYTTDMYFDTETKKPVFLPGHASLFPERGWKDAASSAIIVSASTNYEAQHIQRLKLYDIDQGDERMFYRYSGLIHQRAISKAEYEYELARRQAGSEMGGLFTPQPSSLPTNIRCLTSGKRAIGFVGCSLNTSECRFFLDGADFSIYRRPRTDTRLWLESCTEDDCCYLADRGMFLCVWEDKRLSLGSLRTAWAYRPQLDVTVSGAYTQRPVFWTDGQYNNHNQ